MGFGKASSATKALVRTASAESALTQTRGRPPDVLYVDRGVIALNKPPGLVSQGSSSSSTVTSRSSTGVSAKKDHGRSASGTPTMHRSAFDDTLDGLRRRYDLSTNPYPVHRLDKGTTGVLLLARTKHLARELSQQFRTHAIDKTYLALVHRGRRFPLAKERGSITAPLSFDDGRVSVTVRHGTGGGKAARTAWEVLASSGVSPLSLVRLHPHTGLKHQLRVHLAHCLGAPILGDALYGRATSPPQLSDWADVLEGRLFLHSSSISFWRYRRDGPHKRLRLTIGAPLPADFIKACRGVHLDLPEDVVHGGVLVDGERFEGGEIPGVGGRWVGEPF